MPLTPRELRVLKDVARWGARSQSGLVRRHGPRPNWARLLDRGLLAEHRPRGGSPALVLTGDGRFAYLRRHPEDALPAAPETLADLADHAYLVDAADEVARRLGLTPLGLHENARLRDGTCVAPLPAGAVMTVAPERKQAMLDHWQPREPENVEQLGRPLLYASRQELSRARVETLRRHHERDILRAAHPLILVVREDRHLRHLLRLQDREHRLRAQAARARREVISPHDYDPLLILRWPG